MENKILKEEFGTFDMTKAKRNPFVKKLLKGKSSKITIELDENVINHFKNAARSCNIPFDAMVNNYLSRAL